MLSVSDLNVPDTSAPVALSVRRVSPSASPSPFEQVTFLVSFSEPVEDLTASSADWSLISADARIESVRAVQADAFGRAREFTVVLSVSDGSSVKLDVAPRAVRDAAGNANAGGSGTPGEYRRDASPPSVLSVSLSSPPVLASSEDQAVFLVVFSEPVGGLTAESSNWAVTNGGVVVGVEPLGVDSEGRATSYRVIVQVPANATVSLNVASGGADVVCSFVRLFVVSSVYYVWLQSF